MSELAMVGMGMGALALLLAAACLVCPAATHGALLRFSRNKIAAWALTAVALVWAVWLLWGTPLGRFEGWKPVAVLLTPVVYVLIVLCMDELLASRALGVLFILLPAPVLACARWNDSAWRLLVVGVAYIVATAGIALVLSPYLLRRWALLLCSPAGRCRVCGAVMGLLGIVLVVLSVVVY